MAYFTIVFNFLHIINEKIIDLSLDEIDKELSKLNVDRTIKKLLLLGSINQGMINFIDKTFPESESLIIDYITKEHLFDVDLSMLNINELIFNITSFNIDKFVKLAKPKLNRLSIYFHNLNKISMKQLVELSYQTQYLEIKYAKIMCDEVIPAFNPDCFIHIFSNNYINVYLPLCLKIAKQQMHIKITGVLSMNFTILNFHMLNELLNYNNFYLNLITRNNKSFDLSKINELNIDDNSKYVLKKYLNKEKSNILLYDICNAVL